jgi:hypothetical protein
VPDETRRDEIQKAVGRGWPKGDLKLFLMGHKLRGVFKLIKIKSDEENAWLMMKYDDQYVIRKIFSNRTGRSRAV